MIHGVLLHSKTGAKGSASARKIDSSTFGELTSDIDIADFSCRERHDDDG